MRIMTLLGPGGVGKTRLALEMAHQVADGGNVRVVFVELAALRDAAFVTSAIAEAFGAADVTDADLARRVRAACADRQTLLVLDNCEHMLDAAPLVTSLVGAVPCLRLLATSRAPLRVPRRARIRRRAAGARARFVRHGRGARTSAPAPRRSRPRLRSGVSPRPEQRAYRDRHLPTAGRAAARDRARGSMAEGAVTWRFAGPPRA